MKTNLNLLALGILLSLAGASFGQPVITTQPQSSTDISGTTAILERDEHPAGRWQDQ
jgi:hypothetical protein